MVDSKDPKALVSAAVVLVVVAALVGLWHRNGSNPEVSCKITPAGVALVADGLAHDRPTPKIAVAASAGPVAYEACRQAIDTLATSSTAVVQFEIETATGTGQVDVSRPEIQVKPTKATGCTDWNEITTEVQCILGRIRPPLIDLNLESPTCAGWQPLELLTRSCLNGAIGPPETA